MSQTTAPHGARANRGRTVDPDRRAPFGVGLLKGLGVTVKHLFSTPSTQMYPAVKPDLPPRTRGVIALMDENCTVCMLCSRECPDWCIYIDSHKETVPPAKEGGRARTRNVLDRFAIDFALCMYCGICIEVCPFDALWWSPEFEYTEYSIDGLLHEMDRLREWADTVPAPPPLEEGAETLPEVADAISKKNNELEAAAAAAEQKAIEAEQAEQPAAARASAATAAPARPKPTLAEMEVEGETQVDQEVFDRLVAEGKSERMARSKAKAAWVKAQKQELLDVAVAEWEAEQASAPAAPAQDQAPSAGSPAAADAEAPAEPATPRLADVQVEGAGEIDQDTYDALIAEGKSERIARAKAKAAWVKKRKQEQLDEGGDA